MLFIHGYGANSSTWDSWITPLSASHTLHLVDLKGFGRAPVGTDQAYAPTDFAAHVMHYIRQEDLSRITLCGHSLGGAVALLVALELSKASGGAEPQRLIVVSGAAFPQQVPPFIRFAGIPWLGPLSVRLLPSRLLMRAALRKIVHDPRSISRQQIENYAAPLRRKGAARAWAATARSLIPEDADALVARYAELQTPTLALWGRSDRVVRPSIGTRLAQALPNCSLVVLDACGHIPPEERPIESLRVVQSFLARHPLRDEAAPEPT